LKWSQGLVKMARRLEKVHILRLILVLGYLSHFRSRHISFLFFSLSSVFQQQPVASTS
jgi:hypothetical protein